MATRRHPDAERPVVLAIDHLFVDDESDGLAQAAYDALGALDAAWPSAICPIASEDLRTLVAGALARCRELDFRGDEQQELAAAARRVGHLLERAPQDWPLSALQTRGSTQ